LIGLCPHQADLARLAPPLARTRFFGANSAVASDGSVAVVSTRVIDAGRPAAGAPALAVFQRTTAGAFVYAATLKLPGSDGTFALTDSGGHLAAVRGSDVHVYAREGDLPTGKFVYNKRCVLPGSDMNLEASECGRVAPPPRLAAARVEWGLQASSCHLCSELRSCCRWGKPARSLGGWVVIIR
jgi:hypothetical protein